MQLIVSGGAPAAYGPKLVVGAFVLLACDSVWLWGTYAAVYGPGIARPRGERAGVCCVLLYAVVASAVAAAVSADSAAEAAAAGAVLGLLVFAVFNITTYAMNSDWGRGVSAIDTAYGTAAWAALLAMQHIVT